MQYSSAKKLDCSSTNWNLKYKHSYQCNLNSIIIIIIQIVLEACSLRVGWECSWQPFATGDAGRDVVKCIAKLFPISTKSNQIIFKNINLNRNFSLIDSSYFFSAELPETHYYHFEYCLKSVCNFTRFMVDWIWSLYLKSCGGKITSCYGAKTASENSAQEIRTSEQNYFIPASNICAF